MEKIFHVFVSSTYRDLIDERKKVSEAIAKAGFVAEGMEIFPASSQKQMDFIQGVIDRCDYYVLIIGGCYGSLDDDGLSYTEKEFLYAKDRNIPILTLIINESVKLPDDKMDSDPDKLEKLAKFKESLQKDTLVDFWSTPDQLSMKAVAALSQARHKTEGIGWIRGDQAAQTDILGEINELRKNNTELKKQLAEAKPHERFEDIDLAELDEEFMIRASSEQGFNKSTRCDFQVSWRTILATIGGEFRTPTNTSGLDKGLKRLCRIAKNFSSETSIHIYMRDLETILLQFEALGLMSAKTYTTKRGRSVVFHKLTPAGLKEMLRASVIRSTKKKKAE